MSRRTVEDRTGVVAGPASYVAAEVEAMTPPHHRYCLDLAATGHV
jgi:hypothetical protein